MTRYEIAALVAVCAAVVLAVIALALWARCRRIGRELAEREVERVAIIRRTILPLTSSTTEAFDAIGRHLKTAIAQRNAADLELDDEHTRADAALDLAERMLTHGTFAKTTRRRYAAELAALRRPPDDDTT